MKKLLALLLLPLSAVAADATVTWTHPTQYTSGAPLALEAIRETTVQYGTCTTATTPTFGTLTKETIVPGPAATVKLTGIAAGTYCFRARTTDTAGLVSAWSTVVSKAIVEVKPKAPTGVVVTQ